MIRDMDIMANTTASIMALMANKNDAGRKALTPAAALVKRKAAKMLEKL